MKLLRVMCLLSLACVLLFGQTCPAADGEAAFNWTGPYVGAHVGYGWGNADTSFTPRPTAADFGALAPTTLSPKPNGVVGGIQAGYNYQMGCFVVGIEADFSGSGMSGSKTVSPIKPMSGDPFDGFLKAQQEINWFGTLRPRVGYTVIPTVLLYGTGGLAYGEVSYSANTSYLPAGAFSSYPASFSTIKVGWTAGGGVEYAIAKNWTVKAEYLYMDLGSESVNANPIPSNPPFRVGYNWESTSHIFNIGVNYKF
ncbi:MAG: outer membrane protein [Syntrophobacteraceae bacterium]